MILERMIVCFDRNDLLGTENKLFDKAITCRAEEKYVFQHLRVLVFYDILKMVIVNG